MGRRALLVRLATRESPDAVDIRDVLIVDIDSKLPGGSLVFPGIR